MSAAALYVLGWVYAILATALAFTGIDPAVTVGAVVLATLCGGIGSVLEAIAKGKAE